MNNFSIDVTAETDETLEAVLEIAFRHNGPLAEYWLEMEVSPQAEWLGTGGTRKALVLCAWEEKAKPGIAVNRFPIRLDAKGAAPIVARWLDAADRGHRPDHDGDNGKGFRVFCNFWGHFEGYHSAIVGIVPAWAMYGK